MFNAKVEAAIKENRDKFHACVRAGRKQEAKVYWQRAIALIESDKGLFANEPNFEKAWSQANVELNWHEGAIEGCLGSLRNYIELNDEVVAASCYHELRVWLKDYAMLFGQHELAQAYTLDFHVWWSVQTKLKKASC